MCERDHALSLVLGLLVSVGVDLAGSSISRHDHSNLPSLYMMELIIRVSGVFSYAYGVVIPTAVKSEL